MSSGRHGAQGSGMDGVIVWASTLLRGRPQRRHDLVRQPRSSRPMELLLVIVDASASTLRHQALSQAKGVLAQAFDEAYRRRTRLALLTASGNVPRWQYQGFKASAALQPWLDALGAGGGTPLFAAIEQAITWLEQRKKRYPTEHQRVLILTDGRVKEMPPCAGFECESLLIDIEKGPIRLGRARALANRLGAGYRHIDEELRE
ncbi:VWA domain-containing protein [Pseudomonas sp. NPDC089734]|uniref:vWA domain-containing protein n=1 Tax=Pseudomonas sp. NPDC089734 TaxID=3364469 RepID=UPI00381F65D0